MTRDEWIERARELLAGNEDAAELLGATIQSEVVVAELVTEPVTEAAAVARIEPTTLRIEARPRSKPAVRRAGRLERFARAVGNRITRDEDDRPLRGFERFDVRSGELAEKAIDKGMDSLASIPEKMPKLGKRGNAWAGRKLGRGSAK